MQARIIKDISDFIFIEDKPERADIIFLPGGAHAEVPLKGAEMYREGYAPLVMPSGKYAIDKGAFEGVASFADVYNKEYETECDFYKDVLLSGGVPEDAIICERKATFTKMNAVNSRKLCEKLGIKVKKAMICCKSFHARRCLMYYSYAFPDCEFVVVPTDVQGINRDTWHKDSASTKRVLSELRKAGGQLCDEMAEFLGQR